MGKYMKINVKIIQVLLLSLLWAQFCFAAIKSGVDEDGTVHVRVWGLPADAGSTTSHLVDWRILKAFEKKYPGIKLHSATGIKLPGVGSSMDVGPLMAISGGMAPDILYVNFRKSASYIDSSFLYPLDEYIDDFKKNNSQAEFQQLISPALEEVVYRYGEVNGERKKAYWMIPSQPLVKTMVYRKDLFVKNGLDPNKPPKNWDELLEVCKKLTNREKETYGIHLNLGFNCSWYFVDFLSSTGTRVVTQDDKGEWTMSFDKKEAVPAMHLWTKLTTGLHDNGKDRGYSTDKYDAVQAGRVGITMAYLGNNDMASSFDTSGTQWGFSPVPAGPTGKSSAEINAKMWGIYKGQKDKRVRDAAFKWLAFTQSTEAMRITVDTFIERNEIRGINPVLLSNLGGEYDKYRQFLNKDLLALYKDLIKTATPEPYGKNCDLVYSYLDGPVQQATLYGRSGDYEKTSKEEADEIFYEYLVNAKQRAEVEMLQNLPEDVKKFRSNVAMVVTLVVFLVFFYAFYLVYKSFTPDHEKSRGWQLMKYWRAYIILVPALGSIIIWQYYPLFRGTLMAFQDYKIAVPDIDWVGFDNFAKVLFDDIFWYSIWLSFYYSFLVILFTWLPPVFLAIMLSEIPKGTVFLRVVYYLPAVVSGIVVMFMWKNFFEPTSNGLLNQLIAPLGIDIQYWFEDPHLAMLCLIVPLAWAGLGPGCLIYLAALKGIPDDLYEAADIDGATYWQKVWHIVFPKLKPLLTIGLIGTVIVGFNAADNVLAMTGGGPNNATLVTGLLVWKKAFVYTQYGPATAMAWIMSLFIIGFTVQQLKMLSKLEFKTTGGK